VDFGQTGRGGRRRSGKLLPRSSSENFLEGFFFFVRWTICPAQERSFFSDFGKVYRKISKCYKKKLFPKLKGAKLNKDSLVYLNCKRTLLTKFLHNIFSLSS